VLFCPPRFLHVQSAACHRQRAILSIRVRNPPRPCAKYATTPLLTDGRCRVNRSKSDKAWVAQAEMQGFSCDIMFT
ncbi:hypothetical protein ACJX0J_007004, partial [Zea mays]